MTKEITKPETNPTPLPSWGHAFARLTATVFFLSLAFPLAALFIRDTTAWPQWWGILDVTLAFLLVMMAFVVYGLARNNVSADIQETTYRSYRILVHGIFVLILLFFIAGDRITWLNGLPGIAWRAWLLLYILPEWLACMRVSQ